MKDNKWVRLLAYITGMVNQRLLLQCEYLLAENRILCSQLPTRLRLPDAQRSTLTEIGKRLRPEVSGRGCLLCQTGHHSGLVPAARSTEI